eukprot:gene35385-47551_t
MASDINCIFYDDSLGLLMPTVPELRDIKVLCIQLNDMNCYTKELQRDGLNISLARALFDDLIYTYGDDAFKYHLAQDAEIILDNDFDNGMIKIINNENLTANETELMKPFLLDCSNVVEEIMPPNLNPAERAIYQANKKARTVPIGNGIYNVE